MVFSQPRSSEGGGDSRGGLTVIGAAVQPCIWPWWVLSATSSADWVARSVTRATQPSLGEADKERAILLRVVVVSRLYIGARVQDASRRQHGGEQNHDSPSLSQYNHGHVL